MNVQSYDAPEWQTWAGSGLYSMLPYRRNSQKQSAMPVEVRFNYDWGFTSSNGWWGDPNQSEQTRTHLDSALIQLVEIKALQKGSAASLEMFIAPLIQLVWPETCTFLQPELSSVSRQAPVIETPAGCLSRVWLAQRCTFWDLLFHHAMSVLAGVMCLCASWPHRITCRGTAMQAVVKYCVLVTFFV